MRLAALAKARRASERQVVEDLILSVSGSGLPSAEVQAEIRAEAERRESSFSSWKAPVRSQVSDTVRREPVPKPGWKK